MKLSWGDPEQGTVFPLGEVTRGSGALLADWTWLEDIGQSVQYLDSLRL